MSWWQCHLLIGTRTGLQLVPLFANHLDACHKCCMLAGRYLPYKMVIIVLVVKILFDFLERIIKGASCVKVNSFPLFAQGKHAEESC